MIKLKPRLKLTKNMIDDFIILKKIYRNKKLPVFT